MTQQLGIVLMHDISIKKFLTNKVWHSWQIMGSSKHVVRIQLLCVQKRLLLTEIIIFTSISTSKGIQSLIVGWGRSLLLSVNQNPQNFCFLEDRQRSQVQSLIRGRLKSLICVYKDNLKHFYKLLLSHFNQFFFLGGQVHE